MDGILFVYILSIIIFIRIDKSEYSEGFLSISNTNSLRGIMSIAIVLHHISEHIKDGRFFHVMNHFGYLLVAVFFFLSGYGLMIQFAKKGKEYLKTIWKNRILYFSIILFFDTLLYIIFRCLNGESFSLQRIVLSFVSGHLLAGSSWYLVVQIYFYVFFWLSFNFSKKRKWGIFCLLLCIVLLDIIFVSLNYPSFWCFSNIAFIIGVFWANYKSIINKILNKFYWLTLFLVFFSFVLFSMAPFFIPSKNTYFIFRIISAPIFSIFIIVVLKKIYFTGKLWATVNIISLEIFLIHVLIYSIFRSNFINVKNDFIWSSLTLIFTIIMSIPVHLFNLKIKSIICSKK